MASKTVLIAEDDPGLLQSLKLRCQTLGVGVITASDGLEVLRLIRQKAPDLLILDINMPAADGLSVCEQIMTDPAFDPLPVIFYSGKSDPDTIRRCESLGADFVVKDAGTWEKLKPLIYEKLRDQRAMKRPLEAVATAPSPPKILVIDDDGFLSQALKIGLQVYHIEVLTAPNGAPGFSMARKSNPDVIVIDGNMPDSDGDPLLIRVKDDDQLKSIPVIVIGSGTKNEEKDLGREYERLYRAGAVTFFVTPLDFVAFLDELRRHVDLRVIRPRSQKQPHDITPQN